VITFGDSFFVGHTTGFVYAQLMCSVSLEETLLVKQAVEKLLAQRGQTIEQYHAGK
jgi:hypothetical protein